MHFAVTIKYEHLQSLDMSTLPIQDTLVIGSDIAKINEVEKLVDSLSDICNFDDEVYGKLLLSIVEAVNNAIIHGNKLDQQKQVTISYTVDEAEIQMSVTDQGSGFNPGEVPDPTAPENIEKPCGRGIYLMRHLSDDICFSDNGRCVTLKFALK